MNCPGACETWESVRNLTDFWHIYVPQAPLAQFMLMNSVIKNEY